MKPVQEKIFRYAADDCPVLIRGERGVDKKGAARLLHTLGRRKKRIVFRCFKGLAKTANTPNIADSDGSVEKCLQDPSGGTMIFQDIDQLGESTQLSILNYLANTSEGVRGGPRWHIVGTANRNLEELTLGNEFHPELCEIFAFGNVEVPPLRSRLMDVSLYAYQILAQFGFGAQRNLAGEAIDLLMAYDYPGNISELRTVLEKATLRSDGRGENAFAEQLRNHIRNGTRSSFYRQGETRPNGTLDAEPSSRPNDLVSLDEKSLVANLKCLPLKSKREMQMGLLSFFKRFETKVFYPRNLRYHLIGNGYVDSIAPKTVSQYLGKLRKNGTVVYVGGNAGRTSYRLADRFSIKAC